MHFAEFLNASSPVRLRILFSPTCVGLRYGPLKAPFRDCFSAPWLLGVRSTVAHEAPLDRSRSTRGFASASHCTRGLDRGYRRPAPIHLTRHPFSISSKRYWTMNQFPIGYASQPRLRGRLTLGRRPLPRKPRAFGERDSHPFFRYSYRHTRFCCLQLAFQLAFAGLQNAPLPLHGVATAKDATSVPGFSLVTSSAHHYSTSELLRTLSRNGCF